MGQLGYDVPAPAIADRLAHRERRREILVATRGEAVVGWAAISTDETFVEGYGALLEGLVVEESARSEGVGAQLLDAAEAWARERGCTEMRVQSNVVRERAHRFYQRRGYATIKRQFQFRKPLQGGIEIHTAAGKADFLLLYQLFLAYESALPSNLRHGSVPDAEELGRRYAQGDAAFIALHEGRPIGCVAVAERNAQDALMLRLFVHPASRGMGAGRSLVHAVIRYAGERGYDRVVLDTDKKQLIAAYRLYRSLGFQECDPFAAVAYESPTFMELRLTPLERQDLSRRSDLNR